MSQLARLRAAQAFVDKQREFLEQDTVDVSVKYSDFIETTALGDETFGIMTSDNFYRKHGVKDHETMIKENLYDKLEPYTKGGMSTTDPKKSKFVKLNDSDDAIFSLNSRATNVTFNDSTTGAPDFGKISDILIDRDTGQIHAVNKVRNRRFPITLFRDNNPESPVLFSNSEGMRTILNEAIQDNLELNPEIGVKLREARATKRGFTAGKELRDSAEADGTPIGNEVSFKDVLRGIDEDVKNGTISSLEGVAAKEELWPIIQEALEAKIEEDKQPVEGQQIDVDLSPVMNAIDKLTMAESSNNPDALWKQSQNNQFNFKATESSMDQVLDFVKIDGEYANWSKGQSDSGKVHTPVGKYQFVGATLRDIKNRGGFDELGITGDTLFTPEVQDKLFVWYMNDTIKAAGKDASPAEVRDKVRARWEGATPQTITDEELDGVITAVKQGDLSSTPTAPIGPTERELFGRVDKDTLPLVGAGTTFDEGRVVADTSRKVMGISLDLSQEIIDAYESGNPLLTGQADLDILNQFHYQKLTNKLYANYFQNGSIKSSVEINAELEELSKLNPEDTISTTVSGPNNLITGGPANIIGQTSPAVGSSTVQDRIVYLNGQKAIADKQMYDHAVMIKEKLLKDDRLLRNVGFEQPRKKLLDDIQKQKNIVDNDNFGTSVRDAAQDRLTALEDELSALEAKYPVLTSQYKPPENATKVTSIPTYRLPTNEDGSLASDGEVQKYIEENADVIKEILSGDKETMDKVAAAFLKYGVDSDTARFDYLPLYDPELNLSAEEIALATATMSVGTGTNPGSSFDAVYNRVRNSIYTGDPNITPQQKYEINRGTANYNLQFIKSTNAALRQYEQAGDEYMLEVGKEFQQYIDGNKTINLLKDYKGTNRTTLMNPMTADGGQARNNFNGLMTLIMTKGGPRGGPIELDSNGRIKGGLNAVAQNALQLAAGEIFFALSLSAGTNEKGGLFGLGGRDEMQVAPLGGGIFNTTAVVRLGKDGGPIIDRFTFKNPADDRIYTAQLPNAAFVSVVSSPMHRAILLNAIPEENIEGTASLYVE